MHMASCIWVESSSQHIGYICSLSAYCGTQAYVNTQWVLRWRARGSCGIMCLLLLSVFSVIGQGSQPSAAALEGSNYCIQDCTLNNTVSITSLKLIPKPVFTGGNVTCILISFNVKLNKTNSKLCWSIENRNEKYFCHHNYGWSSLSKLIKYARTLTSTESRKTTK